ncbi:Spo0E family sporulation regulatory protein-aspartic acid phosphatase [Bacillus coreaensis]
MIGRKKVRLLEEIDIKKKLLLEIASELELTNEKVVTCSQELDVLINLFYKIDHSPAICLTDQIINWGKCSDHV